jgi:putative peptidoglycan lipid II flippase
MRLILAINVPAAVGMALLAGPIIHVLFERGEFMPRDTAEMVPVLGMLAVGLPIFAGVSLLLRAFYAQKDTRTPVKAAVLSFVVNIGLALLLKDHFGTLGLAMASTVAVVVQALYLQVALTRRRPELGVAPLWGDGLKIMVAAAVMGLVVWLGGRVTDAWGETWLVDVIRLGLLIPIGAGTFAGLAFLLRLEGRDELLGLLRRRLAGRNTTDS